jgi:hypothetical protein
VFFRHTNVKLLWLFVYAYVYVYISCACVYVHMYVWFVCTWPQNPHIFISEKIAIVDLFIWNIIMNNSWCILCTIRHGVDINTHLYTIIQFSSQIVFVCVHQLHAFCTVPHKPLAMRDVVHNSVTNWRAPNSMTFSQHTCVSLFTIYIDSGHDKRDCITQACPILDYGRLINMPRDIYETTLHIGIKQQR